MADNDIYRTNLGLAEMDGALTEVEIIVRDGSDGHRLGEPLHQSVLPFSHVQLNRLLQRVGAGSSANAYVTIRVLAGSGRVTAYASVVDNRTGDAIFLDAEPARVAPIWVVPVVARTPGEGGTNWVSDLRIGNLGAVTATVRADYAPTRGSAGSPRQATLAIAAGQVAAADDVLWSLFGEATGSGTVTLRPQQEAAMVVTSRTYNRSEAGTYGQYIPAVTAGSFGKTTLIQLERSSGHRVNVGFREVAGGTAELQYWIVGPNGDRLGQPATVTLGPGELVQVNDVFTALGAPAAAVARLDISYRGGSGAYLAYASVVDEVTGDALFELATPLHSTN